MSFLIKETKARSILSKSGIPGADYCINPYTGCSHGCRYCYASFMKRFTNHTEPWGNFVDVKINAPYILRNQLKRTRKGTIIISSVTDPYQPLEVRYELTRKCLEELIPYQFSVDILTKSPLVLRDIDLFKQFKDIEVGITITTNDEKMRKIFEPKAPPVETRIQTVKKLHEARIRTYVFIGPLLPMNPEIVCEKLAGYVDYVFIDRMNYITKTLFLYKRYKLGKWLNREFSDDIIKRLKRGFKGKQVNIC
jgi:DNA repair photolyase